MMNPRLHSLSRAAAMLLACGLGLALAACARTGAEAPVLTSTTMATISRTMTEGAARRDALARAETDARRQLRRQAMAYRLDGETSLEQWAVLDPFVLAVLEDTIRAAPVVDRTVDPRKGSASVSVQMELGPVLRQVEKRREELARAKAGDSE